MACWPVGVTLGLTRAAKEERIGRIVEAWRWGPYKTGDYVFVWDYGADYTTSLPMTPEQIEGEKAKGSGLRDWLTVMSVPKRYVEIVI